MKKMFHVGALLIVALLLVNCKNKMKIETMAYPVAKMDSVVDDYFGTQVADPYRWLEDDNSPQTAQWVAAENEVTQHYLSQIPYRSKLRERLTQLWDYPKYGVPIKKGDYYYYYENNGLQNQSVLYSQKGLEGKAEVFLDPNALSEDGTVALVSTAFSKNNAMMAYSASVSGSDWVEIRVMDVATKQLLPDIIKWVKFSGVTWSGDGFYYSAYNEPSKETMLSAQNRNQKVYYHKMGTLQSDDKLVYECKEHPLRYLTADVSKDNNYLFIYSTEGTSGTEILYKDISKPAAKFEVLFKGFDYDYSLVTCKDGKAIFYTNDGAPNFRLVEVDLTGVKPQTKELLAEGSSLMEGAQVAADKLIVSYLERAQSVVKEYALDGRFLSDVKLPGIGTVGGFSAEEGDQVTFYAFGGFTAPASIYKYDLSTGTSELFKQPEVKFNPDEYTTEQVMFPSKDGTEVSMFIVHRKDMKLNGKNPLYLYGYGGFNISLTPSFSPQNILLMENGGIYVMVNLRGGGEYGEVWHKGGMLDSKQNVFDDFIAAAEYLIAKGYTSAEKLAIAGGSNGGLLVGATMVQRPDLFAVALPAVGVLDMLRFHKFTVGWGWVVEYGSSEKQDQFDYLYKYSPLHNVKNGTCYPATLITTADHDDRVVPAHSFKFAAALQAAQGCSKPTLIRIDTKAGHGAGKPTAKRIEEAADVLSFVFWNTDAKVK